MYTHFTSWHFPNSQKGQLGKHGPWLSSQQNWETGNKLVTGDPGKSDHSWYQWHKQAEEKWCLEIKKTLLGFWFQKKIKCNTLPPWLWTFHVFAFLAGLHYSVKADPEISGMAQTKTTLRTICIQYHMQQNFPGSGYRRQQTTRKKTTSNEMIIRMWEV